MLTVSEIYCQIRVNTFSELILNITGTFSAPFQTSNTNDIFKELLVNSIHTFPDIKQY